MSQSQQNKLTISKRRLMLAKAVQEFPDNPRIRNALIRTYSAQHIQTAALKGVFISYNRADEIFALELDTSLREAGVNVWLDQIDVDGEEDWDYAVSNAIKRCGVMVLVLSPSALEDDALRTEMLAFKGAGKVVIPVIHSACDASSLNLILPPVDFSTNFATGLQQLLRGLSHQPSINA